MSDLITYFENQKQAMLDQIIQIVKHETFTNDKAAVDELGHYMEAQFKALGAETTRYPREAVGDIILAEWNKEVNEKPILFLVHIDTVWPAGTLERLPIRFDDEGRLFGPGVIDMKSGVVLVLTAIRGLIERGEFPERPIRVLMTTDEEIGSPNSEALIKEIAQDCQLALVMEPATKEGAIKSWRKGVAMAKLHIKGRASHAGNAPEQGINSVIEFAQQALEINKLNDLRNGTSVSVTMVNGGTAGNVIPAQTTAQIDSRFMTSQEMRRIEKELNNLHPFVPGAELRMEYLHERPPLERNEATVKQVQAIGERIGIKVREDGSGGGSDGNFTAAMGVPTIDGLGPQGDGLHADHEHIIVNSLPGRAALLAAILKEWQS